MTLHKNCILCNSDKLIDLKGFEKAYLCKCISCSLVFSKRIASKEELYDYYKNYGINTYLSPLTIKRYNALLDKFEPYRKTNKILDIGCGIGFFLDEAKKRGWEVYGTELSEKTAEICNQKGITIALGPLNAKNYDPESFDIITSFEVIEHINNPKIELKNLNEIVRAGGLVYITTPNFDSLLRHKLKSSYNIISYPEHLTYYTAKTLTGAFKTHGFKKLKIETTGISLTRYRTSKGTSTQKIISANSDDEKLRIKMDTEWYLKIGKNIINKSLTLIRVGDCLKGWYIKVK